MARTFASGLDTPGAEPSLLNCLTGEVLVLKDFTTVLALPHDERQGVLAQLREIHDGQYDKYWGTGKTLHWEGHVGFLAGVTPVIDQHHVVMGLLGPRFLVLRLHYSENERPEVARRALRLARQKAEMRRELAEATAAFLAHLPTEPPDLDPAVRDWLVGLADLVTHARSLVSRERGHGALQYAPEPEVPARFALQLYALAQGPVLVAGGTELTTADQPRLARVAWDGIPILRRNVLHVLAQANRPLTTRAIATTVQFPTTTVCRSLEDLQALKLIRCAKGGHDTADGWQLQPQWRAPLVDLLQRLFKVPRPLGMRANAGAPDRREASLERSGMRVRRAHVDARQAGRAVTRPAEAADRQSPG
jgi:hypothetical protein